MVRAAQDIEGDGAIDSLRVEKTDQITGTADHDSIDGKQDITSEEARMIGRAFFLDHAHHGARPLR